MVGPRRQFSDLKVQSMLGVALKALLMWVKEDNEHLSAPGSRYPDVEARSEFPRHWRAFRSLSGAGCSVSVQKTADPFPELS